MFFYEDRTRNTERGELGNNAHLSFVSFLCFSNVSLSVLLHPVIQCYRILGSMSYIVHTHVSNFMLHLDSINDTSTLFFFYFTGVFFSFALSSPLHSHSSVSTSANKYTEIMTYTVYFIYWRRFRVSRCLCSRGIASFHFNYNLKDLPPHRRIPGHIPGAPLFFWQLETNLWPTLFGTLSFVTRRPRYLKGPSLSAKTHKRGGTDIHQHSTLLSGAFKTFR
jgi:hypothetical protein